MNTTVTRRRREVHPDDPAPGMLRTMLAAVQPRDLDDLLDLAGLVGEIDGGHITAATIGGVR